tara:strand:+ start:104 stop:796 length:693 start_codon:yes stop_codon:yes gene_type:complete
MGKITIISKNPGKGIYSSEDETWEYLNKLVEGDLTENAENIIIKTTDNEIVDNIIVVDKEYIYANTPEFITYRVYLKFGGGLQILLNKNKKDQTKFDFRCFYPEGFKISFEADSEYIEESLNDSSFNPVFSKKQFLNNQELPLLFQGYMKGLFVKPKKGYLLFESGNNGGNLYFDKDYYNEFVDNLNKHYYAGRFAESNSESEWMNFLRKIKNAENVENPDLSYCKIYST